MWALGVAGEMRITDLGVDTLVAWSLAFIVAGEREEESFESGRKWMMLLMTSWILSGSWFRTNAMTKQA